MQGAGLPFSLEPGGPAPDLPTYRKMMGLYFSAGVQSVDYFIHIGDVLWNDEIRKEFEATQPLVHLIGKYHAPEAEVAVLNSTRVSGLTGFPWGNDPNVNLSAGYWSWNVSVDATGPLLGVLINGHWVRRFHHMIGSRWDLDLTPWMRFGGQNEIELVCNGRPDRGHVNAVTLDLFEAEVYQ